MNALTATVSTASAVVARWVVLTLAARWKSCIVIHGWKTIRIQYQKQTHKTISLDFNTFEIKWELTHNKSYIALKNLIDDYNEGNESILIKLYYMNLLFIYVNRVNYYVKNIWFCLICLKMICSLFTTKGTRNIKSEVFEKNIFESNALILLRMQICFRFWYKPVKDHKVCD